MCILRLLVRTLKVLDDGLPKILPVVDAIFRQAVKPRLCRALKHQGNVVKGDVLIAPPDIACHEVVDELGVWLGSVIVLVDVAHDREMGREWLGTDLPTEA